MSRSEGQISCLMVTKDRFDLMRRSIDLFCRQVWDNKELIILSDGPSSVQEAIRKHVDGLGRTDIRCQFLSSPTNLGRLRNISVKLATGEFLCQWDDDDLNHPLRLKEQVESMMAASAQVSFMYDQLHYMADTGELFWTDWSHQRGELADNGVPGTLLCRRDVGIHYPESGPDATRGEDGTLQIDLHRRCRVSGLRDKGYLYTYVYHGRNTWERSHHELIVREFGFAAPYLAAHASKVGRHLPEYFPRAPAHLTAKDGTPVPIPADTPPDGAEVADAAGRP